MTWAQIKALLDRLAGGEKLSEEELKSIKNFQEPKPPKGGTDKERELQAEVDRLKTEKEEAESKGLSEVEKLQRENTRLQGQVTTLTKERDTAMGETKQLKFDNAVTSLAGKHKFTDAEYLKYLVQKGGVDVADEAAAEAFMGNLKKDSPKYFSAEVNPGGGGTPPNNGGDGGQAAKTRLDELLKKPTLTMSEASEAAKLDAEIKQASNPNKGE